MITFYNHLHALHQGKLEMFRGELVPCFEVPARADHVLKELERRQLGLVQAPTTFDDAALAGIHAPRYLDFLAHAWDEWVALDPANAGRDACRRCGPRAPCAQMCCQPTSRRAWVCSLTTQAAL